MGNHDYYGIWMNSKGEWSQETAPNGSSDAESREKFTRFFKQNLPYSEAWIKGHHVILLSQDVYMQEKPDVGEGAWYSDEQLEWLKRVMEPHKDGSPAFVMIHQPLPPAGQQGGTHRVIRAQELRKILEPYPNVFVFSGHGHQDFATGAEAHYVKETFHWFINSSAGKVMNRKYQVEDRTLSQGLHIQVWPDRVLLRGREFSTGKWIPDAEWTIPLT